MSDNVCNVNLKNSDIWTNSDNLSWLRTLGGTLEVGPVTAIFSAFKENLALRTLLKSALQVQMNQTRDSRPAPWKNRAFSVTKIVFWEKNLYLPRRKIRRPEHP